MTKRNPAVHAAAALVRKLFMRYKCLDLAVVTPALVYRAVTKIKT
jgi:hypothetical protein